MDNALYVGLSRQMVLRQEMDVIANNIANADTTGFKVESVMEKTDPAAPAFTLQGPQPVKFVTSDGVARDFSQGALSRTDSPFDLGVQGQGMFTIQTPNGPRYTRDGHFRMDDQGQLTTQDGSPVLDEGGGPIAIDPKNGPISVGQDGVITQGREQIGKIGLVTFANLGALQKVGSNLYQNPSNQTPQPATDAVIRQGMIEGSNVNPILEITRMIEVSRAYEQMSKIMDASADLSKGAVQRLGKVN